MSNLQVSLQPRLDSSSYHFSVSYQFPLINIFSHTHAPHSHTHTHTHMKVAKQRNETGGWLDKQSERERQTENGQTTDRQNNGRTDGQTTNKQTNNKLAATEVHLCSHFNKLNIN